MKKRTVWFGNPVYVARKQVVPFIVVQLVMVTYFAGMWFNDPQNFIDFMTDSPQSALILVVIPALIPFLSTLLYWWRQSRYLKRFKRLGGRLCFLCDYEIGEGLESCSECGAEWSLDDLGKGWRKLAEKGGGD